MLSMWSSFTTHLLLLPLLLHAINASYTLSQEALDFTWTAGRKWQQKSQQEHIQTFRVHRGCGSHTRIARTA